MRRAALYNASGRRYDRRIKITSAVLLLALGGAPLPARAERISLIAAFESNAYRTIVDGRITVALDGGRAAFRLGLGDRMCRLSLRWVAKGATGPVEACLTRIDLDEARFNEWRHEGTPSLDPTLFVPLGSKEPLRARLFVRDCHGDRYRRLADLTIPTLQLSMQQGIVLDAKNVVLDAIDERTFKSVARECGNQNAGLPDKPTAAVSSWFTGRTSVTPSGDPIAEELDRVRDDLEGLFYNREVTWEAATKLVRSIDDADDARRSADSQSALKSIDQLARHTPGVLPPQEETIVLGNIARIRARVVDSFFGLVGVARSSKCVQENPFPCIPTTLRVDVRTTVPRDQQDGTAARPFAAIADALRFASSTGACSISLRVMPGTYPRDLTITADTFIGRDDAAGSGAVLIGGSIENLGPHDLTIDGVTFRETPRAAIHSANPFAFTSVHNVTIDSAVDYGIDIDGGMFVANDLRVTSTVGTTLALSSGVGIRLRGGARAAMARVELLDNDGQGIAVIGEDTKAFARAFTVRGNRMFDFAALAGAVSALDQGTLLMETSTIEKSVSIGLHASDRARIHFRAGRVAATRKALFPETRPLYGNNAATHFDSVLELTTFSLSSCESVGIQFAEGALGTLTDGVVTRNPIGVVVLNTTALGLNCLQNDVRYLDNDTSLDGLIIVPGRDDPPRLPCFGVPFVCGWCSPPIEE